MPRFPKIDSFVIALAVVVLAATLWPAPGVTGGPLHMQWITGYGISGVFLLYGLTLSPEKMREGILQWRLHLAVQCGTFILFPILILLAEPLLSRLMPTPIRLGFVYLAVLPSTVSSSVAMTSLARGNVPAAIFNASLSSLLGVFLTPLMMAGYLHAAGHAMALGPVLLKVFLLVILPTAIGQFLHRPLLGWTKRQGRWIKLADRAIVLAIVYGSFCDSIAGGIWQKSGVLVVIGVALGVILLFFAAYGLMHLPCRWLGLNREDRIACLFCASKKSLATGVPLASLIFGTGPALGQIILPIMLYHFFQLIIVSVIAGRLSRDDDFSEASPQKA